MTIKKKAVATAMALTASLAMVTGAMAEDSKTTAEQDVKFGVEGGDLMLTTQEIEGFDVINLGELAETGGLNSAVRGKFSTNFKNPYEITDARGTVEGYHLTVSATQFTEVLPEGSGDTPLTLSPGTLTFDADSLTSITRPDGSTDDYVPDIVITDVLSIDDGEVTVLNAEEGKGAGDWELNFSNEALKLNIDITLDKYIDAKNYGEEGQTTPFESTLTWNLVSAPQ